MIKCLAVLLEKNPYAYLFLCCLVLVYWSRQLYTRLFDVYILTDFNKVHAQSQTTQARWQNNNPSSVDKCNCDSNGIAWINGTFAFDFSSLYFIQIFFFVFVKYVNSRLSQRGQTLHTLLKIHNRQ